MNIYFVEPMYSAFDLGQSDIVTVIVWTYLLSQHQTIL